MIPVLSVCGKDADLAVRLLQWCADLDGKDSLPNLIVVAENGVDLTAVEKAASALACNGVIKRYEPWTGNKTWPWPQNYAWQTVAREIMPTLGQPWFWWEPDVTPLCKGWWQALCDEYTKGGKPFMGHVVPGHGHMNGAAFYPADVSKHCISGLLVHDVPFDSAMRREIANKVHPANHLMGHYVKGKDRVGVHVDNLDAFKSVCDGLAVYHGCADGSLIDQLRKNGRHTKPSTLRKLIQAAKSIIQPKAEEPPALPSVRISLKRISLWSVVWSPDAKLLERTIRVLRYCNSLFEFYEVVLFSCLDTPFFGRLVKIPQMDMAGFNIFVNRIVPLQVFGDFAMSVHEDGFPIRPDCWRDEFLAYDYIGAPWADGVVGNGGFSIESRKLLQEKLMLPFVNQQSYNSDLFICRAHRNALIQRGIKFAPKHLALQFSTETTDQTSRSFGFHGRNRNAIAYADGWRKIEEVEKRGIVIKSEVSGAFKVLLAEFDAPFNGKRHDSWMAAATFICENKCKRLIETGCYHDIPSHGGSTVLLAQLARDVSGHLISYELEESNIAAAQSNLQRRGLHNCVTFQKGDSVQGIASRDELIDFAYLDSYDCGEGPDFQPCQNHQLAELEAVLPLLAHACGILLDDQVGKNGKTYYSMQRFARLPFKKIVEAYQVLYTSANPRRYLRHRFAVLSGHLANYGPMAARTIYRNKGEYCFRYGYDLKVSRRIRDEYSDPGNHYKGHTWSRLADMHSLVDSGMYDWVWIVGCDTLVTNYNVSLESIVEEDDPSKDIPNLPIPTIAPKSVLSAWDAPDYKPDGRAHLIICADRGAQVQADSFLVRGSDQGSAYLQDILRCWPLYKDHPWVENQAMLDLRKKHAAITRIVPQHVMNCYDYTLFKHLGDWYDKGIDCYGHRGQWQPGDFLIHFPAQKFQKRMELIAAYEPKVKR